MTEPTVPAEIGSATRVRVQTFGQFTIEVNGASPQFGPRGQSKPLELLKVLIACGSVNVPQVHLADTLWPEANGDASMASFTTNLHRLRQLIGTHTLVLRNRALSLDRSECWVDALEFKIHTEQAATSIEKGDLTRAQQALNSALALYRGPFLVGEFDPEDIPSARERFHAIFLQQVRTLARFHSERGDPDAAIAVYRRGLEVDEVAEDFYHGLMESCLAAGRNAEGIDAYRRCEETLRGTLHTEPSLHLRDIYERLRAPGGVQVPRPSEDLHSPADSDRPERKYRRRFPLVMAIGMLLAAIVLTGAWWGYRHWVMTTAVAELKREAAQPLPDTPSIAVLPFANLSGDPGVEYFSNGLTDSIITALARIPDLLVIARTSTFTYKGKAVDVRLVGREMGVRHVLEGGVLKTGNRLRVTAQLIDAATGGHVWADSYDRDSRDLLEVMNDITRNVANEVGGSLVHGESILYMAQSTRDPEAFDKLLLALHHYGKFEKQSNAMARQGAIEALDLDPRYAGAMALLGWTYLNDARYGWSRDASASFQEAETWARKAMAANKDSAGALGLLARILTQKGQHEDALALEERAIEIEPGNATRYQTHALTLVFAGHPEQGAVVIQRAFRLSPLPTLPILATAGEAYFLLKRYEEARPYYEQVLSITNGRGGQAANARKRLIAIHLMGGRETEARALARQELEQFPEFSLRRYRKAHLRWPYRDFSWLDPYLDILRRAGLPD